MKYGFRSFDARRLLEVMPKDLRNGRPKEVITLTITSPPYYHQKDYGHEKQLGYGQEYSLYLDELTDVFADVYSVTKRNGSLWLILDMARENGEIVNLPFDITTRVEKIGWKLKDVIIWEKDKTLPWSRNGQLRKIYEYVIFFSKTDSFKYRLDRIRDPSDLKEWWVKYPERYHPEGKVPGNVWHYAIPVQGSWGHKYLKHFCPFPIPMIERIIQLSSDPGDVVLDPFAGSGSVLATAETLDRKVIGLDLNPRYVELYKKSTRNKIMKEARETIRQQSVRKRKQIMLRNAIERLRQLKYAKSLLRALQKRKGSSIVDHGLVTIFVLSRRKNKRKQRLHNWTNLDAEYYFIFDKVANFNQIIVDIAEAARKPPLSKFGITPHFSVLTREEAIHKIGSTARLYLYPNGKFYAYRNRISIEQWSIESTSREWQSLFLNGIPPILSNMAVKQKVVKTWRRNGHWGG